MKRRESSLLVAVRLSPIRKCWPAETVMDLLVVSISAEPEAALLAMRLLVFQRFWQVVGVG